MVIGEHKLADIESGEPNATRKGVRAIIDKAVLDEDNKLIGFIIRYSSWRCNGDGYVMLPSYYYDVYEPQIGIERG